MVEADGEWHTGDNKYASANWRSSHPPPAPTPARSPTPAARPAEVFVLDSDGEDEDRVKRELSPGGWGAPSSYAGSLATLPPGSQLPLGTPGARVIDLTGDSDDEEPLPPPTPAPREPHALPHALPRHPALNHPLPPDGRAEKRKAPSDDGGDALWKRPRPADPYAHGYAGAYPGYRAPSPAYERPAPAYGGRPTPTSSNSSQQASNGINYRYPY
jgi:E3 SUMO-protein ligase PIAS1